MTHYKSVVLDDFGEVIWREPKRKRKKTFKEVFKLLGKALL